MRPTIIQTVKTSRNKYNARISRCNKAPRCNAYSHHSSNVSTPSWCFSSAKQIRSSSTSTWRAQTKHDHEDPTIFALSTAPGRAAIAIIRISGPACTKIYHALCPSLALPRPRHAVLRTLYSPNPSTSPPSILDPGALTLYFPAPNTSTGEPVLELHTHGGPAITRAVLHAISSLSTPVLPIRHAAPGEFTRRAFYADRMTLPQIEALGDALSAETEEQRRLSVAGTRSGLAGRYEGWRERLVQARGELEALIDFAEDQHFDESPTDLTRNVATVVRGLVATMELHVANAARGELLRAGIKVSLIGGVNVGKSSLLNLVVGRRAAIVSASAGTTRDVVEVSVDLGGFLCRVGDTAGFRGGGGDVIGEVEAEGIRRAKERALESDVVVLVASIEKSEEGRYAVQISPEVLETAHELLGQGTQLVVAVNKIDRFESSSTVDLNATIFSRINSLLPGLPPNGIFPISCLTASDSDERTTLSSPTRRTSTTTDTNTTDSGNIQTLLNGLITTFRAMTSALTPDTPTPNDLSTYADSLSATTRQRLLLETCMQSLQEFLSLIESTELSTDATHRSTPSASEVDIVLAAESLRSAAACLAQITGKGGEVGMGGDVEEVLGVVFEKFCVGK